MNLLRKGKVKDIYEVDENRIIFHFTDRISAFDVILPSTIPRKGEILCKFAEYWFESLNIPNHMIKVIDKDKIMVKKLEIIPIECVVRGYLYGSYYERIKDRTENNEEIILASKLPNPIFDPTTKFEEKDRPINHNEIIEKKWLTDEELLKLKNLSIDLYNKINYKVSSLNFIIADIKFEFGKDKKGNIILGDSIGPDEFRLWDKDQYKEGKKQEAFDKQLVRDWLIQKGYKKELDKARSNDLGDPYPPKLPNDLVTEVLKRYVYTYEKITGRSFN
jgi:phosphoribosylaminoimidazole-succinocarboxamide synthase